MVSKGSFILHDAVRPALQNGAYTLTVTQRLDPPGQSVDPLTRYLDVTGPRFTLPPDQPLSFFPPQDATGEFSTRLPQIVLRRRTLPWERVIGEDEQELPWLALVVLADGEGQLTTGQPVDTTGLSDPDLRDSDTRDVLTVTERVISQVFPSKQDLPWLCHVREVDLSDTELALGDDDGWLAVVLANRLPQPGVHYTACLISLEGHGGDLPAVEPPTRVFTGTTVYTQAEINAAAMLQRQSETFVDGTFSATAAGAAEQDGPQAPVTLVGAPRPATRPPVTRDAWSAPALPGAVAAGQQAGTTVKGAVAGASSVKGLSVNQVFIDPGARLVQFTVLKHWSFTCADGGDFESLVRGLDDGMLGTLPPPAPPATTSGTPPAPPGTRPDPVVTDTGHVETAAVSRRGDPGVAWYRGPFTPRQILRAEPDETGPLPLIHAADQARRVGPDGREDLSLAAAFEIGRLLAVAQPAVVAGLLGWRQDGYGAARVRGILNVPGSLQARLLQVLDENRAVFSAGVSATLLGSLGAGNAARLGPVRPLGKPGPALNLGDAGLAGVVAEGFGMAQGQVSAVLASGPAAGGLDPSVTASQLPAQLSELTAADFTHARAGLAARVTSLVAQARLLSGEEP
jgi:hypothetical protein